MIPDRTFLVLAVLGVLATLMHFPIAIREGLGLVYSVHALRSHRRAIRAIPVKTRP